MTIAKLLAFNIYDPVLHVVTDHIDKPQCSGVTMRDNCSVVDSVSLN